MHLAITSAPIQTAPAETLGRYRIVRELGRGAHNRVYLADDTHLGRQVVIKTLASRPDPARSAVLVAEGRTIGQLNHPNIIALYDAFEDRGMHCVVLEYIEGETLENIIRTEGRIAAQRATCISIQVLEGLAFAHERGIVHRDINLGNILIDASGTARIMNFGIAAERPDDREVTRNADVFSVGMSLYEMLTGRAAIEARDIGTVMQGIANQPFESPSVHNSELDEGLDQIVMRALSTDPAGRYVDAAEMRLALEHYLRPTVTSFSEKTHPRRSSGAIEFLLTRMRHKSSFPALSQTISAISRVTSGEAKNVQDLTAVLLKDFSLTNKLLRLVNSSGYGQFGGTISTVSRAVLILGFDAIRNLAVTLVLFEHLHDKGQADKLRDDVIAALFTGIVARGISNAYGIRDPEEGFICGVFHNLGRMLVSYYLLDESVAVNREMQRSGATEEQAARMVLGVSYEEIGVAVARSWNLPDTIVRSMQRIAEARPEKPKNAHERFRLTAALANALSRAACAGSPAERDKSIAQLVQRFGAAIPVDARALISLATAAMDELLEDTTALLGDNRKSRFCQDLMRSAGDAPAVAAPDSDTLVRALEDATRSTAGVIEPQNASDPAQVLSAGIQDITETLVGDFKLSDLLRIILETMYRAMGFSRVMLFMRDARTPTMIARLGYGTDIDRIMRELRLPLGKEQDVFSVVLERNLDVLVTDIEAENIRSRIPDWFRKNALGQSFVVLPVVVDKKAIGMFYGDKALAGELVIEAREMNLLKTLRNQAVLALKPRR
jgi:serine/threonine protein kinase